MCCPVLFCHILLKFSFLPVGRRYHVESFCLHFLHTSCQMCFSQRPDWRPPQITGGRVSAVHQGGVGAPTKLATFRVYDAVVDFVERSVRRTRIAPRPIQDLLENFSGRCWSRSPREIVFFPEVWKVEKKNYQIGSIGDRPGKVWLGSSGILNFWPSIVTGLGPLFMVP